MSHFLLKMYFIYIQSRGNQKYMVILIQKGQILTLMKIRFRKYIRQMVFSLNPKFFKTFILYNYIQLFLIEYKIILNGLF